MHGGYPRSAGVKGVGIMGMSQLALMCQHGAFPALQANCMQIIGSYDYMAVIMLYGSVMWQCEHRHNSMVSARTCAHDALDTLSPQN